METKGPALVVGGGGARLAFQVGVLIGANMRRHQFKGMYSLSSGGPAVAYFAAGQIEEAKRLWVDELAAASFVDWHRLFVFERPCSVHALIEDGCRTLDIASIPHGMVHVSTLRLRDGATISHELTLDNTKRVLGATCALPWLADPVWLDDAEHVDGGVEYTFPVQHALKNRHRKILAIDNRPPTWRMRPYGPLACLAIFPTSAPARAALRRRAQRYAEARMLLDDRTWTCNTLLLCPREQLPAERLTTDKQAIRRTFELGLELGRARKREIHAFLAEPN